MLLWCEGDERSGPRAWMRRRWSRLIPRELQVRELPGTHNTIMWEPGVREVAAEMLQFLAGAE
jgi:thioesterase domain-containing protein